MYFNNILTADRYEKLSPSTKGEFEEIIKVNNGLVCKEDLLGEWDIGHSFTRLHYFILTKNFYKGRELYWVTFSVSPERAYDIFPCERFERASKFLYGFMWEPL